MNKQIKVRLQLLLFTVLFSMSVFADAQNGMPDISNYSSKIAVKRDNKGLQNYKMTAIYTNRDLYGNFIDKTKIRGNYTRGLNNGKVNWDEVYVAKSPGEDVPYSSEVKQEYMENYTYTPSEEMLGLDRFQSFPPTPEGVYSRNLIWDMMAIEDFAWNHLDSLKPNKVYSIPDISGAFDMSDIGTYSHRDVLLCWTGITSFSDKIHYVLEFEAIDNLVSIDMEMVKTKGTEQYWGTILISADTGEIGQAVMYSGSAQEIEVAGMDSKIQLKTIRELYLEKLN